MAPKLSPTSTRATRRSPVPAWVPDDLPVAPGVYEFEAEGGAVLYVGKSVNLRRRVRGYFYGGGPTSERLTEMLALARTVRWRATGSDLEARLVEAGRIVDERPRYNRALRNRARGWYLEIDWRDPFPRLRVVRSPRRPGARRFGPYRGRASPERVARLLERVFGLRSCPGRLVPDPDGSPCLAFGIGLCSGPCVGAVGLAPYRRRVEAAVAALADPARALALRTRLARERDVASRELAYERAADRQRKIAWIDELEAERGALERPWMERSWLIALPHARPDRSVLIGMVRGLVLPIREANWERGGQAAVADACYAARVAELRAGPVLEPGELVASRIVSGWLMDGAPGGDVFDLDQLEDSEIARRVALAPPTR